MSVRLHGWMHVHTWDAPGACHLTQGSRVQTRPKTTEFLRVIKIRSTTSFRERYFAGKIKGHFSPSLSLLRYQKSLLVLSRELWWMNQEWLELRWGSTKDKKRAAVHGALCTIPPRNSNQFLHLFTCCELSSVGSVFAIDRSLFQPVNRLFKD
jgi:hypothetical protein